MHLPPRAVLAVVIAFALAPAAHAQVSAPPKLSVPAATAVRPQLAPAVKPPAIVKTAPARPAYKLDAASGKIRFGDGQHGRRPPAGSAKAGAQYRHGAGASAKLPAVQRPGKLAPAGKVRLNPLEDGAKMQSWNLQKDMQKQSKQAQTLSNAQKSKQDTENSTIRNAK